MPHDDYFSAMQQKTLNGAKKMSLEHGSRIEPNLFLQSSNGLSMKVISKESVKFSHNSSQPKQLKFQVS